MRLLDEHRRATFDDVNPGYPLLLDGVAHFALNGDGRVVRIVVVDPRLFGVRQRGVTLQKHFTLDSNVELLGVDRYLFQLDLATANEGFRNGLERFGETSNAVCCRDRKVLERVVLRVRRTARISKLRQIRFVILRTRNTNNEGLDSDVLQRLDLGSARHRYLDTRSAQRHRLHNNF